MEEPNLLSYLYNTEAKGSISRSNELLILTPIYNHLISFISENKPYNLCLCSGPGSNFSLEI